MRNVTLVADNVKRKMPDLSPFFGVCEGAPLDAVQPTDDLNKQAKAGLSQFQSVELQEKPVAHPTGGLFVVVRHAAIHAGSDVDICRPRKHKRNKSRLPLPLGESKGGEAEYDNGEDCLGRDLRQKIEKPRPFHHDPAHNA